MEAFPDRTHDEYGEQQCEPNEHLVRWDLLHAERLA
jgi:hypothetical protein